MNELLTALDVENVSFSRGLRGYTMDEVDDFLDRTAASFQKYAERSEELERSLQRLQERQGEYEELKDSLQEALLMAQKSSSEKIRAAEKQAEALVAESRVKAEGILNEAMRQRDLYKRDLEKIKKMRVDFTSEFRALLARYSSLLDLSQPEVEMVEENS